MKRPVLAIIAIAALGMTTLSPAAADPTTKAYTAGFISDTSPVLCDNEPGNVTGQNIGAVCFNAAPGSRSRISVQDLLNEPVGYFWSFLDQHWNSTFGASGPDPVRDLAMPCTSCGFVCASTTVTAPPGSVRLRIAPFGPIIGAAECLDRGSAGFGTTGTVTRTPL